MADEEKKEIGAAAVGGPTQTIGQTKIVWDDSNMRSSYANVANVAGGREEIVDAVERIVKDVVEGVVVPADVDGLRCKEAA